MSSQRLKMRPRFVATSAMTLLLAASASVAAVWDLPDFSGQWVLNDLSQLSTDIAAVLTVRMTDSRSNARWELLPAFVRMMTVAREVETGVRIDGYQIGQAGEVVGGISGGTPETRTQTRYSASWNGERLEIVNGTYDRAPGARTYSERTEVWALESNDRLVITLITRTSETPTITRTMAYRRQPLR